MQNRCSRSSDCLSRNAFTLLETILALSLSALLLAAIYAAIDQSWRTSSSGREEMERAQLARALIHKIEVDIRAITFVPPPPTEEDEEASGTTTTGSGSGSTAGASSGSNSGGGSGGSTGGSSTGGSTGGSRGGSSGGSTGGSRTGSSGGSGGGGGSSGRSGSGGGSTGGTSASNSSSSGAGFGGLAANNTSAATGTSNTSSTETTETEPTGPNSHTVGIRGTANKFEISIARPLRDLLPGSSNMGATSRTSDLRQVSYSFSPTGSTTSSGLIRTEGDRMAVETLEASGGIGTQISSTQMLAPEVSNFVVRYFDGRTWHESWDTDTIGRIPRAVEISIAFAPPKRKPPIFSVPVSRTMDSFRTVIVIPVSDPFPQDFVQ